MSVYEAFSQVIVSTLHVAVLALISQLCRVVNVVIAPTPLVVIVRNR